MKRRVLLCDCGGSQQIEAGAIESATGLRATRIHRALCTDELGAAAEALGDTEAPVIACGQEARRFAELAAELEAEPPLCVDIRDRAGWTDDGTAGPKMAALMAEALLEAPAAKVLDVHSAGACLVLGPPAITLPAAEQLADTLAVTVLVPPHEADTAAADLDTGRRYEVAAGNLRRASGTLGAFTVVIDEFRELEPGGRGAFGFGPARGGAQSQCDIILDLSGQGPLFSAPDKRDGYLRADPGDGRAVARRVFEAAQHVGVFEKPLHVRLDEALCAHARAGQQGCMRCLDACPTGAIRPDGDHVSVDPLICAGCGACSSLCPSGAIAYDAPPADTMLRRMRVLAETFAAAGGSAPRLLVHDGAFGAEMISLCARYARGLPADVIPLEVAALAGFGHAEILAGLGSGFERVDILPAPTSDRDTLTAEIELAGAMGAMGRVRLLDVAEPEALAEALREAPAAAGDPLPGPVLALGSRRQVARLAACALLPGAAEPLPLPTGAPYGTVAVDTGACTLCLACASLCPTGALSDNPDKPRLRFQEDACLQCGICVRTCPEKAVTLVPRFDPTPAALSPRVMHEEEPYPCIECGKPFGVRSTVERIIDQLAGKHPMFADSDAGRMIRMCEDCRVAAQFARDDDPLAGGERPRTRTTEDYFSKRRDH